VSMGGGQMIADPFLGFIRHTFMEDGLPTLSEAIFYATWVLDHTIELNPGGINGPVNIAVICSHPTKLHEARMLSVEEIGQHRENVNGVYTHLREYKKLLAGGGSQPPIPAPPAPPK
jgi:hypothetical protein